MEFPKTWVNNNHVVMMSTATTGIFYPIDRGASMFISLFVSLVTYNILLPKIKFQNHETPLIISTSLGTIIGILSSIVLGRFDFDLDKAIDRLGSPLFVIPLIELIFYLSYFFKDDALSSVMYAMIASVGIGLLLGAGGQVGLSALVAAIVGYIMMKFMLYLNNDKKEKYFTFVSTVFGVSAGVFVQLFVSLHKYKEHMNTGAFVAAGMIGVMLVLSKLSMLPEGWDKVFNLTNY